MPRATTRHRKSLPLLALNIAIVLILGGGTAAYGALNKTVTLSVDGEQETIRTFGSSVSDVLEVKELDVRPADRLNVSESAPIEDGATIELDYAKPVNLSVDGEKAQHTVYEPTVGEALDELGVDPGAGAYVSADIDQKIPRDGMPLVVSTRKDITVKADGEEKAVTTTAPTVAEVLDEAEVTLDDDDEVDPGVDAFVTPDATLTVVRIEKVTKEEMVDVDFEVEVNDDPEAMEGETSVETEGKKGTSRLEVALVLADGEVRNREVLSTTVVDEPVTQVETRGTSTTPPDSVWDRIAQCESGGNWSINTGNGYYGGLQFSAATWRSVGGPGLPHEQSREVQIKYAEILQSRAGWGQWGCADARFG